MFDSLPSLDMSITYPDSWNNLRTTLSHDWLTGMRGGEKVLELLGEGFPDAPIYSLIHNPSSVSEAINRHEVHTSVLQGIPGIFKSYRYFLPFFPFVVARLKPRDADLVISTSHCVAKALPVPEGARHLCYCFTPMRYAWTFYEEYFGSNPLKSLVLKPTLARLRRWDKSRSDSVHRFVGISEHVQQRIRRFYDRDADVVYPPVDTGFYTPRGEAPAEFDLVVSALVPYKRVDLAVRAYTRSGFPLKVVGVGTELERLKAEAGPNIVFLGWADNEAIRDLYRTCRCLVFPGEEDFGIVPVEVQACGRPVVAFRRGGALETVVEGTSGIFFDEQSEAALLDAVNQCANTSWQGSAIRENAERFAVQHFIDGLDRSIQACFAGPS